MEFGLRLRTRIVELAAARFPMSIRIERYLQPSRIECLSLPSDGNAVFDGGGQLSDLKLDRLHGISGGLNHFRWQEYQTQARYHSGRSSSNSRFSPTIRLQQLLCLGKYAQTFCTSPRWAGFHPAGRMGEWRKSQSDDRSGRRFKDEALPNTDCPDRRGRNRHDVPGALRDDHRRRRPESSGGLR